MQSGLARRRSINSTPVPGDFCGAWGSKHVIICVAFPSGASSLLLRTCSMAPLFLHWGLKLVSITKIFASKTRVQRSNATCRITLAVSTHLTIHVNFCDALLHQRILALTLIWLPSWMVPCECMRFSNSSITTPYHYPHDSSSFGLCPLSMALTTGWNLSYTVNTPCTSLQLMPSAHLPGNRALVCSDFTVTNVLLWVIKYGRPIELGIRSVFKIRLWLVTTRPKPSPPFRYHPVQSQLSGLTR